MIPRHPTAVAIVARVAALYCVPVAELWKEQQKKPTLAEARHVAWWKTMEDTGWSPGETAEAMMVDRASIRHGVRKVEGHIRDGTGTGFLRSAVQLLKIPWIGCWRDVDRALAEWLAGGGQSVKQERDREGSVPPDPPLLSAVSKNSGISSPISSDPRPDSKRARVSKTKPRTAAPDTIEHSARHLELAREKHLDLARETETCLSFHRAKGSLMANWGHALTTWLLRSNPGSPGNGGRPAPHNPRTAAADAEIERQQQRDLAQERARLERTKALLGGRS